MRLWIFLLLLILAVIPTESGRTSSSKKETGKAPLPPVGDVDSSELGPDEEESASPPEKKKPARKTSKTTKEVSEEDFTPEEFQAAPIMQDEVREDVLQRLEEITEHAKDAGVPVGDGQDDKSGSATAAFDVCGKGLECKCEGKELLCDKQSHDDSPFDTLNVFPKKEAKYTYASFKENGITKLTKKTMLPSGIRGDLEELVLSNNHITKIMEENLFSGFYNLRKLHLDNNWIDNINGSSFNKLDSLHKLYLNDNKITTLDNAVFSELKNLRVLVLDGNKIKLSMGLFSGLINLEELSLDNCGIKDLDDTIFDNLHNLAKLSLRNNPMVEIPKGINSLRNLKHLDISGTNIPEFHAKELDDNIFLESLRIENMKYLYSVGDCAFCGLEKLQMLHMGNNSKLREIHVNAFGLGTDDPKAVKSLQHLYLQNCNLTYLPEGIVNWETLKEFDLSGNPIDCNCDTMYLMTNAFYDNVHTESVASCATPKDVKGKPLPSVNPQLICDTYKGPEQFKRSTARAFIFFAFLLMLCVASVGMFHMYSTGRLQVIWNNIRNRPNQFPAMSYANLNSNVEDNRALEADFQPRPEEV